MTVRRHRALQAAGSPTLIAGDGRTVRVRLVAWDTPSQVTDDGGRTWYREQFTRGGLQVPPDTLIGATADHFGEPVGRIVAAETLDDGLYADVRMSATSTADDQLALIDDGLLSVSVEFDDELGHAAPGELVTRADAVVTGLAFTHYPQHTTAAVIGRRSHRGEPPMDPEDINPPAPELAPEPTLEPEPAPVVDHQRSHPAPRRPDPTPAGAGGPAALAQTRFRSLGHFVHEAAAGRVPVDERMRFYRALSAATTADIGGLLQVQWINEVIDLIRPSMPTVQAFSQRPLPDSGTSISRPIVTQRPAVAKQTTQNAAVGAGGIGSQKVTIGTANWTVDVYGGGQEMSLTTLLRSDPAYLDQVIRLYSVEMARKLETDVVAAVVAAADDVNTTAIELPNTDATLQNAFIDAADVILGAIDRLPTLAVINRKMWVKLAKAVDSTGRPLFPGVSLFNPVGSMDLGKLDGEVRSLKFFVAPKMANVREQAVVGVPEAFETMLGPIQTVQNDVPETLTHQHAVFQFASFGKVDASGLCFIDNAA
jgi:hypothetical protein